MGESVFASLTVTYAVLQTVVLLLVLRAVDPYEREPMSALALLALWGAVGATTLSATGNASLRAALPDDIAIVFGRAIYAPVVEEIAKGLALIVFVVASRRLGGRYGVPRFEGLTDGIVYGAAVGLGFAFTEDILYLLTRTSALGLDQGLETYIGRRDIFAVVMLHHALYSAVFGVGLGLATWARRRLQRVAFPALGLLLAIALHAVNNGAVSFALVREHGFDATKAVLDTPGAPLPAGMAETATRALIVVRIFDVILLVAFAVGVYLWLRYQRRVIRTELEEEVHRGLISRTEMELMPRYWRRTLWYWQLFRTGQYERWRILRRMHNTLVELALLKHRVKRHDDDPEPVQRLRLVVENLKAQKAVFM